MCSIFPEFDAKISPGQGPAYASVFVQDEDAQEQTQGLVTQQVCNQPVPISVDHDLFFQMKLGEILGHFTSTGVL